MLDAVSDRGLRELMEVESPNCVSFYISTHATGPAVAEGPIRLKNLTAEAKKELERLGIRSSEAADLLGPVHALLDDTALWAHAEAGLAVFVTSDRTRSFRLPGSVEDAVLVSDRFWIAPLLPFVASDDRFFVLALSENKVRLMRCSRYWIDELELTGIPVSLAEALQLDDRESQLQSHGGNRVGSGNMVAAFHGHAVGDFAEVDRERFLRLVDRGLGEMVGDGSDLLVLAGVDEIVSQFRSLSSHRNIADSSIVGNHDYLTAKDIHKRALPLVATQLTAHQVPANAVFGSPSVATDDSVAGAVAAATAGRVDRLYIDSASRVWGTLDAGTRQIQEHTDRRPGDIDLFDVAARATLDNGGEVFAVATADMPTDSPLAAVLRY